MRVGKTRAKSGSGSDTNKFHFCLPGAKSVSWCNVDSWQSCKGWCNTRQLWKQKHSGSGSEREKESDSDCRHWSKLTERERSFVQFKLSCVIKSGWVSAKWVFSVMLESKMRFLKGVHHFNVMKVGEFSDFIDFRSLMSCTHNQLIYLGRGFGE